MAAAFIKTFQLTPDDYKVLHGSKQNRDIPITKDIFAALDKVQKIHNDCKILMQSGHQTLALDIMEQMTLNQVHTYLHKYCIILLLHESNFFLRKVHWKDYTDGLKTIADILIIPT